MKKILCPVDSSDASDNAIVYAAKIARKTGASLELFNVQVLADLTVGDALLGEEINVALAASQLESRAEEVRNVFRISCEASVAKAGYSLTSAITREAEGFDLIVMGTNGEDNLNQTLFGSSTYRVIRKSAIPLLLVPERCGYSEIQRVVYAFDYWHETETPLMGIVTFAKELGSELSILQIMDQPFSHEAEMHVHEIQGRIKRLYGDEVEISFDTLYSPDAPEGIDSYMAAGRADLLALCARNNAIVTGVFDRSVTHSLAQKATYPIYICHRRS
ncbi:MAG TPA: universal stress protein [Cyclobacteriaceae bacterium]|nr:universal stress protein [Cyclobacteriaceae bacterium]